MQSCMEARHQRESQTGEHVWLRARELFKKGSNHSGGLEAPQRLNLPSCMQEPHAAASVDRPVK